MMFIFVGLMLLWPYMLDYILLKAFCNGKDARSLYYVMSYCCCMGLFISYYLFKEPLLISIILFFSNGGF